MTPEIMNAFKIIGIAILLLILVSVAPLLGIIALVIGIPAMLYYGFWHKNAPFPKPWSNPFRSKDRF